MVFLSQNDYVHGVLQCFSMEETKRVLTPRENVRKLKQMLEWEDGNV